MTVDPDAVLRAVHHINGRFIYGLNINHNGPHLHSQCPYHDGITPCLIWKPTKIIYTKFPSYIAGHFVFIEKLAVTCPSHSNGKTFLLTHDNIKWSLLGNEYLILLDFYDNSPQKWMVYEIRDQRFSKDQLEIYYNQLRRNNGDLSTIWKSFEEVYKTNLKYTLKTNDSTVNYILKRKLIHCIGKITFQNIISSVVVTKTSIIDSLIKLINYQLPSTVLAGDGSYKAFKKTGYCNKGIWNTLDEFSMGLQKFIQNSRGEAHVEIVDKLCYQLLLKLVLGRWTKQRSYAKLWWTVTDRPRTDRNL